MVDEAVAVARPVIEHGFNHDCRTVRLDVSRPRCGSELTGRTRPGGEPYVTWSTARGAGRTSSSTVEGACGELLISWG